MLYQKRRVLPSQYSSVLRSPIFCWHFHKNCSTEMVMEVVFGEFPSAKSMFTAKYEQIDTTA